MESVVYREPVAGTPFGDEGSDPQPAMPTVLIPALSDLVHANGVSNLVITNPWCQEGLQLRRHGLARWSGQWIPTELGWKVLSQHMHHTPPEAA